MAAALSRAPELAVTRREALFADGFARPTRPRANYDVLPNGEFLMVEASDVERRLFAIVNWGEEVRSAAQRR
jgi:hypothetical protein